MNKEDIAFYIDEDINYQISIMSYMEYNNSIATAYDHLGEMYSYKDIEDMKEAQTRYELKLSEIAIEQLQDIIYKIMEYIRIDYCNNQDITDCWHPGMSYILGIMKKLKRP